MRSKNRPEYLPRTNVPAHKLDTLKQLRDDLCSSYKAVGEVGSGEIFTEASAALIDFYRQNGYANTAEYNFSQDFKAIRAFEYGEELAPSIPTCQR